MLEKIWEDTENLLNDLNTEEDELRSQLTLRSISDEYIRQWEQNAARVGEKIDQFSFQEKRETIDSLGITGVLRYDGRRILDIYIYDVYADSQPLEEFPTDSSARRGAGD
jgi:hypothetical protein